MKKQLTIDLNCDMGESFGPWKMGDDEAVLPYVSAVNIACGFHAGDPSTMMKTIQLALKYKVKIGAHPGFQDLVGFGRREMQLTAREVYALVVYQVGALAACAKVQQTTLQHVKPHGALYNMAARKPELADAIAAAVYDIDPRLVLYGLSGSELIRAGRAKGLNVYREVFADRTYQQDGTLTPRSDKHALIHDPKQAAEQVVGMIKTGKVVSLQGTTVDIQADTICLHGDGEEAVQFARTVNQTLKDNQILIR
ncbi:LamB/YcsF family protein [Sphingobacterium puteale]|uniref:5-oxoprolinase subunit A n=1 Tax=Sphingobacterium puteale TaxID=2420510 RepID=A0A420VX27_9SPHI|nr:5-oxoprolinase subunit PxpA [Sphingobacterium puteale]RKO70872.1 LamB/YcsF family protein [Sphingobacterium puteale]